VSRPRLLVTGASGLIGRHLLDALKQEYRIFALARRSQAQSRAPVHPGISWLQADVGDRTALEAAFRAIGEAGGADVLVHLAAHYDFTGNEYVEYWRTNVHGMRNVLELAPGVGVRRVVFPSSLAACRFPPAGRALDETSPPDGEHIYARSKKAGEEMLREFQDRLRGTTVRFAALFSDWCEYAPLFMFLQTWLSNAWNRRVLGGRGRSAIPYLHIRDAVAFLTAVIERGDTLAPGEVLVASPDGAVTHAELFEVATAFYYGAPRRPLHVPRVLCGPAMRAREVLGRFTGHRPFERAWMARYIDLRMTADGSRTRERLGWAPRPRLHILRRMPFLIQHLRNDPSEWTARNHAALKAVRVRANLLVHSLLKGRARDLAEQLTEALVGGHDPRFAGYRRAWNRRTALDHHALLLRHLLDACRTGERAVLALYCRDLAGRWHAAGLREEELEAAIGELERICLAALRREPGWEGLRDEIRQQVTMTLNWARDEVFEVYESLEALERSASRPDGT
jgi:nucleoside-diphosphate-sugar epimerase